MHPVYKLKYNLPYQCRLVASTGSPSGSSRLPTPVGTRSPTHPSSLSAPRPRGVHNVRGWCPLGFFERPLYRRHGRQRGNSKTGPSQLSAKFLRVVIRRRFASANAPKGRSQRLRDSCRDFSPNLLGRRRVPVGRTLSSRYSFEL